MNTKFSGLDYTINGVGDILSINDNTYSYYHLDHLNSTKCVTDELANIEVLYEYRAFGEQLKRLNAAGEETEDSATYTYGGKELDDETNLYYFNVRYYDATTGRFINVDPIQDGSNWYVYCGNNPLSMVDPTGLSGQIEWDDVEVEGIWQIDFKNYRKSIIDRLNKNIAEKDVKFENNIKLPYVQYTEKELQKVKTQWLEKKSEISTKSIKVKNLLNDLYDGYSKAAGVLDEATIMGLLSVASGAQSTAEFLSDCDSFYISEYLDANSDILDIPIEIEVLVGDIETLNSETNNLYKELYKQTMKNGIPTSGTEHD